MNKFLAYLKARRASIDAEAAALDEQIQLVENPPISTELPTAFDPLWKDGARLTTRGRKALEACFRQGMRQSEVARLFRISLTRAHVLHKEELARVNGATTETREHV